MSDIFDFASEKIRRREMKGIRSAMNNQPMGGFPDWVEITTCKWRTNSYLQKTPHGVVRKTIRSLV